MTTDDNNEKEPAVYELCLDENDIKIIRWCLQVSADAVSEQAGEAMPPEDAMNLVAWLTEVDARVVNQIHKYTTQEQEQIEGQLSLLEED